MYDEMDDDDDQVLIFRRNKPALKVKSGHSEKILSSNLAMDSTKPAAAALNGNAITHPIYSRSLLLAGLQTQLQLPSDANSTRMEFRHEMDKNDSDEDSDDDRPLSERLPKKPRVSISNAISDSDDYVPLSLKRSLYNGTSGAKVVKKDPITMRDARPSNLARDSAKPAAAIVLNGNGTTRPIYSGSIPLAGSQTQSKPLSAASNAISDSDDDVPLSLKRNLYNGKSGAKVVKKDPITTRDAWPSNLARDSAKPAAAIVLNGNGTARPIYSGSVPLAGSQTQSKPLSAASNAISDSDDDMPLSLKRSLYNGTSGAKVVKKDPITTRDAWPSNLARDSAKPAAAIVLNGNGTTRPIYSGSVPLAGSQTQSKPPSAARNAISDSDDDMPLSLKRSLYNGTSGAKVVKKDPITMRDAWPSNLARDSAKPAAAIVLNGNGTTRPIYSGSVPLAGSQTQSKPLSAANSTQMDSCHETHENDSDEDSDDDKPLSERLQKKPRVLINNATSDSDDDLPLSIKRSLSNGTLGAKVAKKDSIMRDDARPYNEKARALATPILNNKLKETLMKGNSAMKVNSDEDEEDDIPLSQRISTITNMKKSIMAKKPPSAFSKSVVAAKKMVVDAKKAKFKQASMLLRKGKSAKKGKVAPGAGGGKKWSTLEHNGVIFPPPYKPHGVKMLYEGKPVDLSPEAEEVATMFAVMQDTDFAKKPKFLANFWKDWKEVLGHNHVITKLENCDFTPIYNWHLAEKEKKKQIPAEEKKRLKEEKTKQEEKYTWALVDGVKEKVGNFRVEPPGLFRGRGDHPKMGKLKRRIFPKDIVINIGKGAPIPECPMPGHRWKEIRHDNTVTWLAYWIDPINAKEFKYVFLAASSSIKGQSDKVKYEKARLLKRYIGNIRKKYTKNFTASDETARQIAVATYLIDRLALRAGNEKDDDEADTVGCCSLKVEHVTLVPPMNLQFDFLGKDSIRYFNTVEVVEPVYKAIGDFKKKKKNGMDLFDKLDTSKLNAHLKEIMPGLTAKVFRTYNASITLDEQLETTEGDTVPEKIASYNFANKQVAILCNHQRSVSKSHDAQMERLEGRMQELESLLDELKVDFERAKKGKAPLKDADGKPKKSQAPEVLEKKIMQTSQKIDKMKLDIKMKDDLKTIALGTSKINYMDPRITVAWCKRNEVQIEKIFNKSLLAKFSWAMDVDMDYRF